jgi:hypothetical protein
MGHVARPVSSHSPGCCVATVLNRSSGSGDPLKIYMALMIALFAVAIGLLAYEIWFVG